METLLLYIPYLISAVIGTFTVDLIFSRSPKPPLMVRVLLGIAAGLGISGAVTFSSFLFFDQYLKAYLLSVHGLLLAGLTGGQIYQQIKHDNAVWKWTGPDWTQISFLIILIILSLPFWYLVHFYAYGGWDAWATWNLKAKFLFLGGTEWNGMFDDKLWRASPHYPLLLPLINAWGWIFQSEPIFQGPCFTAYITTVALVGLMVYGLWTITRSKFAIITAPMLLLMGFYVKLSLSQYADNLVGLYLLSSLFCIIMARRENSDAYAGLCGLLIGMMSFSKNEGLLAAVCMLMLAAPYLYWMRPKINSLRLLMFITAGALIGFVPTLIFLVLYAPESLTFINGFTSDTSPVTSLRVKTILGFYTMELYMPIWQAFSPLIEELRKATFADKWNGIWLIVTVMILTGWKYCLNRRNIIIPAFLLTYMSAVTLYYAMNTYFPIDWWLQVTLHRIISAFLPTVIFWSFLSVWPDDTSLQT